jgi:magnesium transporter
METAPSTYIATEGLVSDEQRTGLLLAVSSSIFIGSSFIVKKKGLRRAGVSGVRAGIGGYSYLREPLWWAGLLTMVIGEVANFAAYAFAPAVLVTPLGALSILVSAILAHHLLNERLNIFGLVGCVLCVTGSLAIVLHAPEERPLESVLQIWGLAMQPAFLLYALIAVGITLYLIFKVPPEVQMNNILVYIAICSIVGSLSVVSCKALGIALKLTFYEGNNQLGYPQTYFFVLIVATAVITQMNYLNKALDLFNTAIVTPIYYVMFTSLTILASCIMYQEVQGMRQVITQLSGFATIIAGTFLLHVTKDMDVPLSSLAMLTMRGSSGPVKLFVNVASSPAEGGGGNGLLNGNSGGSEDLEMTSPLNTGKLRKQSFRGSAVDGV